MSVPGHINFLLHVCLVYTLLNSSAFALHLDAYLQDNALNLIEVLNCHLPIFTFI
jgi:hypothetical protein